MKTNSLTQNQKEAIEHFKGPLLIVAGPGAGKTWVLVERVLHLINHRKVDPGTILVTTFTEKAANELKAKINKKLGFIAGEIHISTIHSFCHYILESYPDMHDFGASFDVIDEDMELMFLRNNLEELGISEYKLPMVMDFYDKCSENRIDPEKLEKRMKELYPKNKIYQKMCRSYKRYLELLKQQNKVDFAGLQKNVLNLLENSREVLEDLRGKIQFILVDEYQDTNPVQDRIFQLISYPENNICVVGDDDQSIYAFRGANIYNFIKFPEKYPETKIVTLSRNFRSTSNIIQITEEFMNQYRYIKKEINPWRGEGNDIVLLKNIDEQDEAEKIVDLIKEMKERKIIPHYGYVTLLFRSVRNHAQKIITQLKIHGIPYTIRGSGSFLKREEIRTMLYLLSFTDSSTYDGKFKPKWGKWWNKSLLTNEFLDLNPETQSIIMEPDFKLEWSSTMEDLIRSGIKDRGDVSKLLKLYKLREGLKGKEFSVLEVFYSIIRISGYLERLLEDGSDESENKIFNLSKLSSIINKYTYLTLKPSIRDFLQFLYMLPRNKQYDEEILEDPRALKIMTVHQAKGLEFPVIIICNVMKNKFPQRKRANNDLVPIPRDLLMYDPEEELHEEHRLFYVAMTRAQDNLIISTSKDETDKTTDYSPFIKDIGIEKFTDPDCIVDTCKEREILKEPLNVSFSSINAYINCPFMYKLVYYYLFEYVSTSQQKYGEILHNCLNMLHTHIKEGQKVDEQVIIDIVGKCWTRIYESSEKDIKNRRKLEADLYSYYEELEDYLKEVVSTEEPFSLYSQDLLISGRTDLVMKNRSNELELVDFKSREETGLEETQVELQLKIYNYALKEEYQFDKLCAYHFSTCKRTYFESDEEDLKSTRELIENICTRINKEEFSRSKTALCESCFFNFLCDNNTD